MASQKIATCCYCGARTALVLTGERRHELACASCGAPLHDLKRLKASEERTAPPARPVHPEHWGSGRSHEAWRGRAPKKSRKKKKKSLKRRALGELWDIVEDIFD